MKKLYISPESKILMAGTHFAILDIKMTGCYNTSLYDLSAGKERIDESTIMPSNEGGAATTGGFGSDNGPWESIW